MREILFRGKSYTDDKWHYGYYILRPATLYSEERHEITELSGLGWNCPAETIGQYIGFTDKNGKKVFEGDIVKTNQYGVDNGKGQNSAGYDTFIVIFADGAFRIDQRCRQFYLINGEHYEVIGNVHDTKKSAPAATGTDKA